MGSTTYDLTAPAKLLCPVATPHVNSFPRETVPASIGDDVLTVTCTLRKSDMVETEGDAQARAFAQLLFELKHREEDSIVSHLGERSADGVIIGVAHEYHGWSEDQGDKIQFNASVQECLLFPEKEV